MPPASVLDAIGNTPLVRLRRLVPVGAADLLHPCDSGVRYLSTGVFGAPRA